MHNDDCKDFIRSYFNRLCALQQFTDCNLYTYNILSADRNDITFFFFFLLVVAEVAPFVDNPVGDQQHLQIVCNLDII